jgi:hypothetical protein
MLRTHIGKKIVITINEATKIEYLLSVLSGVPFCGKTFEKINFKRRRTYFGL